jgi:predicted nucleic acid-binding Zn ribbon protein
MTSATLQKQSLRLEKLIRKASRMLLEFEVAQSEWERSKGMGKAYKSADHFMRHIMKKVNS